MVDFKKIAEKWQKKWQEARIFEADVDKKKKKFFITFPYPYVNGSPHIGHGYSFLRTETYARFKRMQGYNVLFPQGFHATGEPILGVCERLRKGDKLQERTLLKSGASKKDIEKFMEDPKSIVFFWMKKWKEDLRSIGASVDWRRSFVTTDITPTYSKFIEWQYLRLKDRGFVKKGTHPVIWCPHCASPTGDHDRLEGEGESPIEYTLLKFKYEDAFLMAATLRPETVYGVTNVWVNPDAEYVKAEVDGERWIIAKYAVEKLTNQLHKVKILEEIDGKDLIGGRCVEPINGRKVPILPAHFVDVENATGIVMSVPAHAPYDYVALKEILENDSLMEEYGLTKEELEPISIIKVEGFSDYPAKDVCERMGITSQKEQKKLDEATKLVYKREYHTGVLKEVFGKFAGRKVQSVKDTLIEEFRKMKIASSMWECTDTVVCRCTTRCHVKILKDQWFITYSDEKWKRKSIEHIERMTILPEEARHQLINTVEWLKDKACARKSGLGTKLPWDREWIVETLSDSTIYMAYYTIARIINERNIDAERLTPEVFDYIFLRKGDPKEVAKESGLDERTIEEMREEFEYFYPVDMRCSAKDLVQNHLTFFIMQHIALWEEMPEKWPRAIAVNGRVMVEGEKMSKSKGNIIPLRDLIEKFGADLVRINIVCSGEDMDDADWRAENIKGYESRLRFLADVINDLEKMKNNRIGNAERFLLSKLQKIVKRTTESYEILKFRTAVVHCLFEASSHLKWYMRRCGDKKKMNREVTRRYLETVIRLLCPMVPHYSEEMWEKLGNSSFVSLAEWPEFDKTMIDEKAEKGEELIRHVLEDAENIIRLVKRKPKKLIIYVAEEWKHEVQKAVVEHKGNAMKVLMQSEEMRRKGREVAEMVKNMLKRYPSLEKNLLLDEDDELNILMDARTMISNELGIKEVNVVRAGPSKSEKASKAMPFKPGIEVIC